MSNKTIVTAVVVIAFLFSPIPAGALKGRQEIKVPDALNPGLDYLLALVAPDTKDTFGLGRIKKVLDFVASPKSNPALYYTDKKFDANSVYYEFEIQSDLDHILRYTFNPEIPSFAFRPSSVRLSYWSEVNGRKRDLPKLWHILPKADSPIIVRGVEHTEITPDLFSGAYYQYDTDELLILCKDRGRRLLINIARQKDKSDVGRKGIILGKDEDWHYFYSGQVGLTKTGLGWVNSYMYDSFSVSFYYEVDQKVPLVKCGTFKWLRAGWSNLNLVNKKHIHRGMERFAKDFKAILEHPKLPQASELASIFSKYQKLSLDELREKVTSHIRTLTSLLDNEKARFQRFAEQIKSGSYLNQMTRREMQAILVREEIKVILRP